MIIGEVDLGPASFGLDQRPLQTHTWAESGQQVQTATVHGGRDIPWHVGGKKRLRPATIYVEAPTALGGALPASAAALRYLVRQLQELSDSQDFQPVYFQWRSGGGVLVADPDDGWWVLESVAPAMETEASGWAAVDIQASFFAPAAPSSLAAWVSGAALSTTYTAPATPLVAFPVGSTAPATALSRTGGEGVTPYSILALPPTPNPVPFVRPATIASLYTGQVHVFDTINTGSNPVPTSGAFQNANWVEVFGPQHDLVGDYVVTNGLLLLLFQVGQIAAPTVYVWNTSLAPAAWSQAFTLNYKDSPSFNVGTTREVTLDRVGLEEVRLRARLSSSAGEWAQLRFKLQRGMRHATVEYTPLSQANAQAFGLDIIGTATPKIAYNESAIADAVVQTSTNLAASTANGYAAVFGTGTNGPLYGWLYQSPPATGQPSIGGSSDIGVGDGALPLQGNFLLYGIWAAPYAAAQNLQAEAESGALGTGWSSVVDAAASGGHAAKAASGTASGNADLFGTSFVPTAGAYDVWFRVKVTSTASSTAQMLLGLWDATSSVFIGGGLIFAPNAISTSYVWVRLLSGATPTAGHNMQFRAVTNATLTTDWFIDEAVLLPKVSATQGQGDFPADIFTQFLFDRSVSWVRG